MEQSHTVKVSFKIRILHVAINAYAVNCDISEIVSPVHGQVSIEGVTATYICDAGYTLSGSQSRTCGADGTWTLSEPSCEGSLLK